MVEDKNVSLVYHYGNVKPDVREKVLAEIVELVVGHGYIPVPSHGAIEIKPPVVWSKGHAALLILNEIYGKNWEKKVHVIFMGDDTSDEDAMKVRSNSNLIDFLFPFFSLTIFAGFSRMGIFNGIHVWIFQMLKGRGTTFRITAKPDFQSNASYKIQSVATATFILEWLVNHTISNWNRVLREPTFRSS